MEIAEFTRVVKEDEQAPPNRQLINSKTQHFSTDKRTALPNDSKPYQLKIHQLTNSILPPILSARTSS